MDAADKTSVSAEPHFAGRPAVHDVVEIVDLIVTTRVSTIVESASDGLLVLRLEQATRVPEEAPVRWFDGATAWQAVARLEHIDAHRVSCQITPPHDWAPTPARRSLRTPIDESPLLVQIVSSSTAASGRRLHTTCLDISETGCRATWRGGTPCVGDAVDLTWDVAGSRGTLELGWVAARVTRLISLPSGATDVCFSFEVTKATQAAPRDGSRAADRARARHAILVLRLAPDRSASGRASAGLPLRTCWATASRNSAPGRTSRSACKTSCSPNSSTTGDWTARRS